MTLNTKHNGLNISGVPLFDLKEQYKPLREEVIAEFEKILDSQYFINGPAVDELESLIAQTIRVNNAIGVSSGSDALLCALMALGVKEGDEVICPPFTFFATAGAIARVGAKPVFVDIDIDTFNIDSNKIEDAITNKTHGILPVHLFGQMADMPAISAIAKRNNLWILEDAAQAIGATRNGKQAGTIGDIGAFSFFPTKNLGGAGDGGLIVTDNKNIAEKITSLRNHGMSPKYYHSFIGGNFRLDTLQAAYLKVKLPYLESWSKKRRENAALYNKLLNGITEIKTPVIDSENISIYNQYVIRAKRRDELKEYLTSKNIGCEIYYPLGLHIQQCFAYLGYKPQDFPNTQLASNEVLALPIYPELHEAQIKYVAKNITDFYS